MRFLFLVLIGTSWFLHGADSHEKSLQSLLPKIAEFQACLDDARSSIQQLKNEIEKKDRQIQNLERQLAAEHEKSSAIEGQLQEMLAQAKETQSVLLQVADGNVTMQEPLTNTISSADQYNYVGEIEKLDSQLKHARSLRGFCMHKKGIPLCIGIFIAYIGFKKEIVPRLKMAITQKVRGMLHKPDHDSEDC